MVEKIVIIADDLTGGADTGVQFCPFFDETVLVPYHQLPNGFAETGDAVSRAMSIWTNSRALQADIARERLKSVASRFSQSKPKWIYKKVDSCLRGNLGAEIEAIMDTLGFELSFIAPAFPEMGRTTANDIHRVQGIPVSQTEISRDPVAPVTESRLSQVVAQQSRYKVGHVALDLLQGDEIRLQKEIMRLASHGARHIVFDSTSRDHLDNLSRLLLSSDRRILPVGSAGLAASLGHLLPQKPRSRKYENRAPVSGNHLLVSGTVSKVTKRQIEVLVQTYPYEEIILAADLLADSGQRDVLLKKASDAASVLSSENVIIRIGSSAKDQTTDSRPKRLRVAEWVAEGLGIFVAAALNRCKPGFLFVTGGDTADAALTALNGGGIRILGEIVSGMVEGRLLGGPLNGLAMITKAGAFGKEDTLVVLHETWKKMRGETR
jgi:uncharacterized protein YgbK (DUF1537 family)